jgi:hypothetical protein
MYTLSDCTVNWFCGKGVYDASKNIHAATYAFVMAEKMPTNNILPFNFKDLIYVGVAGGLKNMYIGDKKNKNSSKITLTTNLHSRMKNHLRLLESPEKIIGHPEEKKYKLFHDEYANTDLNLYICLMIPKPHVEDYMLRNTILLIEREQTHLYHQIHKNGVLMNLDEHSTLGKNRQNPNSYSQTYISAIKSQNLFELGAV